MRNRKSNNKMNTSLNNGIAVLKRCCRIFLRNRKYLCKAIHIHRRDLKQQEVFYAELLHRYKNELEEYQKVHVGDVFAQGEIYIRNYKILSYNGDRMGKVFLYNGQICRGIYQESVAAFKRLWNTGLLQVLGAHHLIPETIVTEYYTDGYPIIIKHSAVEMSVSSIWNDAMIYDAAILICLIKQIANLVGFTLHDGHINNVSFESGKPIFTDIGSFVEDHGQPTICDREILFTAAYRLISSMVGNSILKHYQLYDECNNAIWTSPRVYDDMTREYQTLLKAFKRYHRFHSSLLCNQIIYRVFDCYNVQLEYISVLFGQCKNQKSEIRLFDDLNWIVGEIKNQKLDISSVVDVGGTEGQLALTLQRELLCTVRCLEADQDASVKAYRLIQSEGAPINTFLFNYMYGASNEKIASIRSDLVVARNVTNNYNMYHRYHIDSVFNALELLSNKYIVVTYHLDEEKAEKYIADICQEKGREIEIFEQKMTQLFDIITRRIREVDGKRKLLYIGKRKEAIIHESSER